MSREHSPDRTQLLHVVVGASTPTPPSIDGGVGFQVLLLLIMNSVVTYFRSARC